MTLETSDTLQEIAEKATQAEWTVIASGERGDSYLVCEDVPGRLKPICVTEHGGPKAEEDATFIATFDPPRVLALLAALRDVAAPVPDLPPSTSSFNMADRELRRRAEIARQALEPEHG